MTEMRQYVCWTDEGVGAATPRDAASLDSGHFQAVHHPLRLQQRPLGTRSSGRWVEEDEIVRVLEGPLRSDGYLLVPIVGASGTGKSHVVRWVRERTREREDWESRYLPKNNTSIRRVIEIVIEDLEGPSIEAAKDALQKAPAQSESEKVLAERLLDELALITSEESLTKRELDHRTAQMKAKLNRNLPDIFRDPVARRRLTGDGAVIPRLVKLAMKGRTESDGLDDDAIRIGENDLPLEFAEIGKASEGAKILLGQLATIPELKAAAIRLINEALPAAVKRVFVSNQVDLIEVLREVRRELLANDKQLVLFVEDLTVLHGVEREFLDAIIEPARSPDGDLCPLRVLFAVTEGHFDELDTVRTRCDDAYCLDATYGSDGVNHDEAISFIGRYLNACRHDPATIQESWQNRQNNHWIPNACDACDHQVHCHETFGQSAEGYGLYPYNREAIHRFVQSLGVQQSLDIQFDPRDVVRVLVNQFLRMAASELGHRAFPSDELLHRFHGRSDPIPPIVESQLKSQRPDDSLQVVNLMRYWSVQPTNLTDSILAAFGLDTLAQGDLKPSARPRGKAERKPKSTDRRFQSRPTGETIEAESLLTAQLNTQWSRIFKELESWAGNRRDLGAKTTNDLKKLIHKSVIQNLDFSGTPLNFGQAFEDELFRHDKHIHINGSVTHQSGAPIVMIEQDADTAVALQGLILLESLPGIDASPESDKFRRKVAYYLEEWTESLRTRLEQPPDLRTQQAVIALLVCALVSDTCQNVSEPGDYLAILFGENRMASRNRSSKWQQVVAGAESKCRRLQPLIQARFGEARGTGGVRTVRADLLLPIIREFVETGHLESTDPATDRFMRSVKSAVNSEWESLERQTKDTTPHIDSTVSWTKQAERVLEMVNDAHHAGRLSNHDDLFKLRELASHQGQNAHKDLVKFANIVQREVPIIERLQIVASGFPETVVTTCTFVRQAERTIAGIKASLDRRQTGNQRGETLEEITSAVLAEVDRLTDAVKELGT